MTALTVAVRGEKSASIRVLAELGAELVTPDYKGRTAIMLAADEGLAAPIGVLAELGADLNATNVCMRVRAPAPPRFPDLFVGSDTSHCTPPSPQGQWERPPSCTRR